MTLLIYVPVDLDLRSLAVLWGVGVVVIGYAPGGFRWFLGWSWSMDLSVRLVRG